MNESTWVTRIARIITSHCLPSRGTYDVVTHEKLPYGYEIRRYREGQPDAATVCYETDLMILERARDGSWVPRVVIEAKINSINTHDAITYSEKASTHKAVHPYLRYGVLLGNRSSYSLPGRLFRHGAQFDFMMSFKGFRPSTDERRTLRGLIHSELTASRSFEQIIYDLDRHSFGVGKFSPEAPQPTRSLLPRSAVQKHLQIFLLSLVHSVVLLGTQWYSV